MHARRAVNQEPIPGYRLLEPLGEGGFGQVWKCEAPGGLCKAIKFVEASAALDDACAAEQELRALQHVKSIRHPFLLSIERVEMIDGHLVIVMELADKSLHDLLEEHRAQGRPGVPRDEILAYLREAAEVLDLMNQEHGLQHLDVKPRNLFLVGRHVKVADFGLVNSLAELHGRGADGDSLPHAITPLYASPETFEGRVTPYSDQYSLAVTFQELVSGTLPYSGRNVRQLLAQVTAGVPDLSPLAEADRPVVAKALSKDPRERFASCTAFVEAFARRPSSGSGQRAKARTTSFEFSLGDLATTAIVGFDTAGTRPSAPDAGHASSGLVRRKSRVLHAVRPVPLADETLADTLEGYQLQECLSRGALGELWRASGAGGEPCLVRFLPSPETQGNSESLDRLASLTHPLLPPVRLLEAGPGRVALVSTRGETSLADQFKQCQAAGLPGIPRQDLLAWLSHFAHALDELYQHHQIQHLALSPRHLAVCRSTPLLLEFGLAELLMLPLGTPPATLNPRYAAAELFDGLISDSCDQYSLALIYQELLVGLHPFRNLNARQMASAKTRGQPELSLLPAPDRAIVMQALSAEPEKRFRSCREFIRALEETTTFLPATAPRPGSRPVPSLSGMQRSGANANEWVTALEELVAAAARGHLVQSVGQTHYRLTPGVEIEHHTWARLPAGMAKLKMSGFREQYRGTVLRRSDRYWLIEITARVSLFQRCLGQTPSMLVEVTIGRAGETRVGDAFGEMTPVRVRLEPRDCGRGRAEQLLGEMGPAILTSIQTYFSGQSTKQQQERYPLAQAVHVQSMGGVAVTGRTRDVGREAMTLLTPCELPVGPVKLTINRWGSPLTVTAPGQVRDCARHDGEEGHYEIDVRLG